MESSIAESPSDSDRPYGRSFGERLRRHLDPLQRHLGPRIVLFVGCLLGMASIGVFLVDRPHMVAINYFVYHVAAEAVLSGEGLYTVHPEDRPAYRFLYPPIVVLAWIPFVLVDPWVGYTIQTLLSVAAGVGIGLLVARYVESAGVRLGTIDRVLLCGFAVGSVHSVPTVIYGNVNLWLALALLAGVLALERGRETAAGILFALPALVKVFPAAIGLWLVRARSPRAVVTATVTGLGGLAAGAVVFGPATTVTWIEEALLPRREVDEFAGGLAPDAAYVTVRQPLSHVLPSEWLGFASVLILAPILAYLYLDISEPIDRLVAVHGTIAAVVLFFPSYFVYLALLYPTLLPLLYLLDAPAARYPFLAGAFVAGFAVTGGDVQEIAVLGPEPLALVLGPVGSVVAVMTPPLLGVVLTLIGCVAYRYRQN